MYEDGRLVLTLIRETPDGPLTEVRRAKVGDKGRMMTTIVSVEGKDGSKTGYGFYWKETDDGQRASSSR